MSRQDTGSKSKYLIEARKITKKFGEVVALDKVDFYVKHNEIVGLVGDNGAGKSTLVKILSGILTPDEGEIYINGKKRNELSKKEIPIEVVYQERTLAEQQSLWRNFFMGREITSFLGFIDIEKQKRETEKYMRETLGFKSAAITPDSIVGTFSGGEKRGIEIGRAMCFKSDMIILDEPTIQLSLSEAEKVLDFVRNLKETGKSCIFISHTIYHAYPVVDRFVIIDKGRIVGEVKKTDISSLEDFSRKLISVARTGKLQ